MEAERVVRQACSQVLQVNYDGQYLAPVLGTSAYLSSEGDLKFLSLRDIGSIFVVFQV